MTTYTFGRVSAGPGKHGPGDWRVTVGRMRLSLGEVTFLVGMLLLAEDRYSGRYQDGRYRFWYFLDRALAKKTPEEMIEVAQDCLDCVRDHTLLERTSEKSEIDYDWRQYLWRLDKGA